MSDERRRRYSFGAFTLSPSRRVLLRSGRPVSLIPRYLDLLLLLVARRHEALHRREILDVVWSDVVVSDGALSQAVRTLRRALGDDPRDPTFIRTLSRHGYQFIHPDVVEGPDEGSLSAGVPAAGEAEGSPAGPRNTDAFEAALAVLLDADDDADAEDRRREAAETLHALGTDETLRRLDRRPGYERARALLRDACWDSPGAGRVPILGRPGGLNSLRILFGLRLRRALRLVGSRWSSAIAGGAAAGLLSGVLGGAALRFVPGSTASNAILVTLPLVGTLIGGTGAVGVGAGLAAAEVLVRSSRRLALLLFGAAGGGCVGAAAHLLGHLALEGLVGGDLSPVAGGFEGTVLGGAVGLGYGLSTPTREGGMATPRRGARLRSALVSGLFAAAAAVVLTRTGSYLGATSLDFLAQRFPESQVGLAPLARLVGEARPGPVTRTLLGSWEGLLFGFGVVAGLTRRPRGRS